METPRCTKACHLGASGGDPTTPRSTHRAMLDYIDMCDTASSVVQTAFAMNRKFATAEA
jgi:hypothetical protein